MTGAQRAVLSDVVARMASRRVIAEPHLRTPAWLTSRRLESLRHESQAAMSGARRYNGKSNAPPGPEAEELVAAVDLPRWVQDEARLDVMPPHTATYIQYGAGDRLELHLDDPAFGHVNVLICLRRRPPADPGAPTTSTVFVLSDTTLHVRMDPGQALLFDGTCYPHGRTPLAAGEEIHLLNVGMHVRGGHEQPHG